MAYQGKKSSGGGRRAGAKSHARQRAPSKRPSYRPQPRAAPGRSAVGAQKRLVEIFATTSHARHLPTKAFSEVMANVGSLGAGGVKTNFAETPVGENQTRFWSEIRPLGVNDTASLVEADLGGYRICNIAQNATGDPTDMSRSGSAVVLQKLKVRGSIHWRTLRQIAYNDVPAGGGTAVRSVSECGQVRLVLVRDNAAYDPKASCPAREILVSGNVPSCDGFLPPGYAGRYRKVADTLFSFDADDNHAFVTWDVPLSGRCQFESSDAHAARTNGLYLLVLGTKFSEVPPLVDANTAVDASTVPVITLQLETTFMNVV